jgi:hypothetical protein
MDWSFGGHTAKMMPKYRIDGNKLRDERDKKGFSQEDLEQQTKLLAILGERAAEFEASD